MSGNRFTQIPRGIPTESPKFRDALDDVLRQIETDPSSSSYQAIVTTHAQRLNTYKASAQYVGFELWETDRLARYYCQQAAGGAFQWVLEVSFTSGTLANRPGDLGVNDKGFSYLATDSLETSKWSGAQWNPLQEVKSILLITHAQRIAGGIFAATNYADGTILLESDRHLEYYSLGGVWIYKSGTLNCTSATLQTLAAGIPGDTLGANDAGMRVYTSDYQHVSIWSGTVWGWAPGELGSNYFVPGTPNGGVWHGLDGSSVLYQNSDGSLGGPVVLPNSSTPFFFQTTTGYNPTVQPASIVGATDASLGTQVVQSGSGASTVIASHQHTLLAVTDVLPKYAQISYSYRQ